MTRRNYGQACSLAGALDLQTLTLADLVEFGGMLHGFLSTPMFLHGARRGVSMVAAALREALVRRAA